MMKKVLLPILALVLALGLAMPVAANGLVNPPEVSGDIETGASMTVEKLVTTPPIPPVVDICLLEDETGSFVDDIGNLQTPPTASDIYEAIVAASPNAQFAVTGFRDYPTLPYGNLGDWVFRMLSNMSPVKANWLNGIGLLTAGGGADTPEAQYDAIVAATTGVSWRDPVVVPRVQHVLVVATDAPFHLPGAGKPHVNTQASTIAALNLQNIIVIGLKAPGAGAELDALAAATGGSVQPLSPSGDDIAEAILAGLEELTTDVWWDVTAVDEGLTVELSPDVYDNVPGDTTVSFIETISVAIDATPCETLHATVEFYANEYPDEGAIIGTQQIDIHVIAVPVDIDIKPGSYPNSINLKNKGVVPVALLGSDTFDVAMVDVDTLMFAPAGSAWLSGATPAHAEVHYEDVNMDGYVDLVSHYRQMEIGLVPDTEEACLRGRFLDGRAFEGCDSVRIVPPK